MIYITKSVDGFTLIELIVVMTMVGLLFVGLLVYINPMTQVQKSQDAQKTSDLQAIKSALDLYYHDFGSYPNGVNLESALENGNYIKKMPDNLSTDYSYFFDASLQWYFLKAKKSYAPPGAVSNCNIESSCISTTVDPYICAYSGRVVCPPGGF